MPRNKSAQTHVHIVWGIRLCHERCVQCLHLYEFTFLFVSFPLPLLCRLLDPRLADHSPCAALLCAAAAVMVVVTVEVAGRPSIRMFVVPGYLPWSNSRQSIQRHGPRRSISLPLLLLTCGWLACGQTDTGRSRMDGGGRQEMECDHADASERGLSPHEATQHGSTATSAAASASATPTQSLMAAPSLLYLVRSDCIRRSPHHSSNSHI